MKEWSFLAMHSGLLRVKSIENVMLLGLALEAEFLPRHPRTDSVLFHEELSTCPE